MLNAATGGTERHPLALEHALRLLFNYLHAHVVPTAVYAASSDFGTRGGDTAELIDRIERAADGFGPVTALQHPGADSFDEPTPFEQLLAR